MRYKHIVTIGSVLIAIFAVLAALMYYFNQGCPKGTFPCKNDEKCVLQRKWCDGEYDCPDGEDESEDCIDIGGDLELLQNQMGWGTTSKPKISIEPLICPYVTKNDPGYYESCIFENCTVVCRNFQENEIPKTFSKHVTKITFINSTFTILKDDSFYRYAQLHHLFLQGNRIQILEPGVFLNQDNLILLVLSDNMIGEMTKGHFTGLTSLMNLIASNNSLRAFDLGDLENSKFLGLVDLTKNFLTSSRISFPYLPVLRELNLDQNLLEWISDDMFDKLPKLSVLTLESNRIEKISSNAFNNLVYLIQLELKDNKIKILSPNLFRSCGKMSKLSIGYNPIEYLPEEAMNPLKGNLLSLGIEDIGMDHVEMDFFNSFPKLKYVYFTKFHYCTMYAPNVKVCLPVSDGVSSLSHLLGKPLLRAAVWGISCVTCLGNALVLWGRFTARDENRVLSIVIRNLAVSDLLMGLYLLIIGIKDMHFRDNYNQEANGWISSWSCTLLGMLAMTSSEVSVLILSFMSVERFMLIAAPLKGHHAITPQTAAASMIVVWVIGVTLALIPAIHWRGSTRFYGLNGMCFPLHIDEPFLVGWEYSAFIFLGVNLLGLVIIFYVYAGMFVSIWRTRHATPLSVGDSEFALRFFLIVMTDAVCWAPIIILKILALADYPVPPDLHAWVVIFILPVNSAVNPLLYTFTTPKFRERVSEGWFGKMRNIVSRRQSRSGSQTSNSYTNKSTMLTTTKNVPNEDKSQQILNETLLIKILAKDK